MDSKIPAFWLVRFVTCPMDKLLVAKFLYFHRIRLNKIFRADKKRKITAIFQRHFLQFSKIGDKDKELCQKMLFVQQI